MHGAPLLSSRSLSSVVAVILLTTGETHAQSKQPKTSAEKANAAPAIGMKWGRGQIDAGGRYSIIWQGTVERFAGASPNPKIVSRVEATDSVDESRNPLFVGHLEVACGSRVVRWTKIERMQFTHLDEELMRTGNFSMFTPSPAIGQGAWELLCGDRAKRVLAFEEAVEKTAPLEPGVAPKAFTTIDEIPKKSGKQ